MNPNQVLIVGRLPNSPAAANPSKHGVYPLCATDFYKLLRERDIDVRFEHETKDRQYLSLHSVEIWLPVLEIGVNLLLSVGAGLLSNLVFDWLAIKKLPVEESVLHVEYRVVKEDTTHEFKADGKGTDVLQALEKFEEKWK